MTPVEDDQPVDWMVVLKVLFWSGIGVSLFLLPVDNNGSYTIVLGILTQGISALIGENMRWFTVPIFVLGGFLAAVYNFSPRKLAEKLPFSQHLISKHWLWSAMTIVGAVIALMTLMQVGPEWVIGKGTGVTAFVDVAGAIFLLIGLGCLFLPFLTDYGLLEFVGILLQRPFQLAFRLPGRATIDTLASWVGASSIAVIMTSRQYENGYYSARESAVIATNFSVVSIPFVFFIVQVAGIPEYFFPLYGSMLLVCLICAWVTPKLPPLSWIPDTYFKDGKSALSEAVPSQYSRLGWAVHRTLTIGAAAPSPQASLQRGVVSMLELFLTMMPAAMTIQFSALVLYEHTPVFQWLTFPFIGLLELMQVPEAVKVAPGLVVGLLDQFVPAIIAGTVDSALSKFVLAGLSVTQLIFFAESAILITRSPIPLSVPQLVMIFFVRTAIALPLLVLIGHWLFPAG